MSPVHSLGQFNPSLRISNRSLERVNRTKLLGIHFSEHLYWEEHVHNLSKSCYSVLGILRKIKKLKTYLTITLEKLKLSRPVWLGTGWILRCEYRREGAYFVLSFVLLLSVLTKLKRTLEKHKVKQAQQFCLMVSIRLVRVFPFSFLSLFCSIIRHKTAIQGLISTGAWSIHYGTICSLI